MKHLIKPLLTALLLLCSAVINAHDFRVDGIYYNILSSEDKTVEVTSGINRYSAAVTIPASVTYNSITYSVTSIGYNAFVYCYDLTSIEIPSSVTSIGERAFGACSGLTSIEIPSSVTSIGNGAFSECEGLTSIEIPSSVTSIGERAFERCYSLISIEIPSSVTSIGESAFAYCGGLTSIEIPSSVTSIGEGAFDGCYDLTSIEIPSSVTSIGEGAFSGCSGLTSIVVDKGNTIYDSRNNCNAIIETASNTLIAGCKNTIIPEGVTSIGASAFSGCTGLTSIEIPSSVTSIGEMAFEYCQGLTSIVVDEGNSVYDSRNNCNAIIETASNTLIVGCVNTIIPEGVTSIGESAFGLCIGLTSIEIPNSVTSIGNYAFYLCNGLTSIEIPSSVTSIGNSAFSECDGLTSIEIPSSVTSIGESAFRGCNGLTSIEIPSSVTSIGASAFSGCTGLTSIEIPSSVTSIGDSTFEGCDGLTSIEIPSSVTSIGDYAFSYCTGLTSIISEIPADKLFVLGSYAFYNVDKTNCTLYVPAGAKATYASTDGWKDFKNIVELGGHCGDNVYWSFDEATGTLTIDGTGAMYNYSSGGAPWGDIIEQITSLDIKSGVTTIGDYAFNWCIGLTSIVIPKDITSIGFAAFDNCRSIESITVDADNSYYDSRENCNAIIETATNILIRGCKNSFIPNNVTSIGDYAFQACKDLTSFVIPEGVTSIGDYAFSECYNLTSIVIPSSVSSIGSYVFYHCYPLTSIEIPEGVTTIGDYAFFLCQALTSIEIPSSVTSIGDWAFHGCRGLATILIPEGVTSIGNYAFQSCSGLSSIAIPSSVTSIGAWAFYDCDKLTEIVSNIPAEDLFDLNLFAFDFGVMDRTCTLYVPAGAKETYAAKEGWKYFEVYGNIVELTNEITINDGEAYTATEAQEFGKIIYNRTFNNTNWQAWYVPFAVDYNVLKEDFSVAEINDIHMYDTDDDGTLDSSTLEIISVKSGTLQANYPYFIKAKETGKKSIVVENTTLEAAQSNYIDCSSVKFKYYFIGTTTGVSGSEMYNNKYYAMSGGSMKYAQDENVSLKPFRWYMKVEARTGVALPKEVRIRHIDDITNVEEIEAVAEDNIYYDLSGRRVENPTKGIYILNGKKVFVK